MLSFSEVSPYVDPSVYGSALVWVRFERFAAFFHYFATKNDLGYALVDELLKDIILDRWTRPLAAHKNPVKGIITRFRKLLEATSEEGLALGCPLNNLTQEMSSIDPIFRDKLGAV